MSKAIDKAFAKAYARRRTPPAETPAEIQRAEERRSSVPAPHVELGKPEASSPVTDTAETEAPATPIQPPAEVTTTDIDPDTLQAILSSVTQVVTTSWPADGGTGLPELPEPAAETEVPVEAPVASPAPETPAPETPASDTNDILEELSETSVENDLLEGLKRAVDAVKQTDTRLRQEAAASQMFVPLWEVDRFLWPDVVVQLEERIGAELRAAAEGMLLASCRGIKTLGITGLSIGRGTSTITLLLAKSLIAIGGKVAMVDAAGTLAGLAELCGIEAPYGWNTALLEDTPMEEGATLSTAASSVIAASAPDTTESLARLPSDRLAQAWKRLQTTYDMTLVDLPPVDAGGVEAIQRHSDLCDALLIVQTPVDTSEETARAVEQIRAGGLSAVGIVHNGYTPAANTH